jgi:hypothetical protein
LKVPQKIASIISSVNRRKIPGFIYNLPDDLRKAIVGSQKKSILIEARDVNSRTYIANKIAYTLGIQIRVWDKGTVFTRIEHAMEDQLIIINQAEFLATVAFNQIEELMKVKIPIILLSSHYNFPGRLRETKFYRDNVVIEYDCNELTGVKRKIK